MLVRGCDRLTVVVRGWRRERLGGMPPSKQKIRPGDKPFLKDTATLAAYNFADGTVLQLGVRERGRGKR